MYYFDTYVNEFYKNPYTLIYANTLETIVHNRFSGNYYGDKCEVDGEVLAVAIGASVAAVVIIILTLVCLCMWR